jgi:hypothetical protein
MKAKVLALMAVSLGSQLREIYRPAIGDDDLLEEYYAAGLDRGVLPIL